MGIENTFPDEVVRLALEKCQSRSAVTLDSCENYVLRVSGRDEYFLGHFPLAQFKVCIDCEICLLTYFLQVCILRDYICKFESWMHIIQFIAFFNSVQHFSLFFLGLWLVKIFTAQHASAVYTL